ncbi:hypothetical protein [Ramlibacter sp.]|uniref:hypothetical protein n=1 Tax=Ramlibacter sp. TaxID=1917967 RepID=UPI0035B45BC6
MNPQITTPTARRPDPGRLHELARVRAAALRREAQARWVDAAGRALWQGARALGGTLANWAARPLPAPRQRIQPRQGHRPCA